MVDQTFGYRFCFPLCVGAFSTVTVSGEIASEKWPAHKCFQAVCDSQHTDAGKALFLRGRQGITRECDFRPLSVKNCLDSKMWDLQVCPPGPKIQQQVSVFPCTFCSLKTHPNVVLGMPMRKQAARLCLRMLIAILCLPRRGDIYLEMGRPLAYGNLLLALEIPKSGTNTCSQK